MRVSSTEIQNNFGKYLKFVEVNEEIIVTRNGKDVARIIPLEQIREHAAEYHTTGDRVTYEEFLELVEASDQRFELIDGVVYNLSSPSYKHQHAVHELHGVFYNWFKGKPCSPLTSPFDVTFIKSEDNICVVQPDILVICDKDKIDEKGKYQGIPTLVVEVLSPTTRSKDIIKKLELYKQCGVQEYWVVNPMNQEITIYAFQDQEIVNNITFTPRADEAAESFCFAGLSVTLQDVFVD